MLNKVILSRNSVSAMRSLVRRSHETRIPEKSMKYRTGHMDEALVPSGDWKEAFKVQQSKYNKQLGLGAVYFVITVGYMYSAGYLELIGPPPFKNE